MSGYRHPDADAGSMNDLTPLFVKGQRVCAKTPYQQSWRVGIITDVFLAPVTQQYVYVIGGEGYYADEVTEFVTEAEPQSLRVAP